MLRGGGAGEGGALEAAAASSEASYKHAGLSCVLAQQLLRGHRYGRNICGPGQEELGRLVV